MAPIDVVVPMPPTSPRSPQTPPSSPTPEASDQVLTVKDARQFLELLKSFQATQTLQPLGEANQLATVKETPGDQRQVVARASKLEFKTVNEI